MQYIVYDIYMSTSTQIQLNTYKSYIETLLKRIKKENRVEFRNAYDYYSTEYLNLLSYALEPMVDDGEIY